MSADLAAIRARISTDHAVLRGLMRALLAAVHAAERDPTLWSCVHDVLGQLNEEMDRHFAYEESVLLPPMRQAGARGTSCIDQQLLEHEEQRRALMALAVAIRAHEERASDITGFLHRVEKNMAEEEARL